jgi:hypothetical protein
MRNITLVISAIILSTLLIACASSETTKKGEMDAKKAVNCATAEGDIRALQSEKVHASQQIADGVTAIVPIGLVAGLVTGTEGGKAKVASGDYNRMLDAKIAEIKQSCGIQ